MGKHMEIEEIFDNPALCRAWLLDKALENAPLDEALRLAQAAHEFLIARPHEATQLSIIGEAFPEPSRFGKDEAERTARMILDEQSMGLSARASNGKLNGSEPPAAAKYFGDKVAESGSRAWAAGEGTPSPGPADVETNTEVAEEPEQVEGDEPQPGTEADLADLVSLDDIIRYLRQRDDVVVSAGSNSFLVNGRFYLNPDQLLDRANKMRQRQRKPPFQPIPRNFSPKITAP